MLVRRVEKLGGTVVLPEWLEQCEQQHKRVHEADYALDAPLFKKVRKRRRERGTRHREREKKEKNANRKMSK